MSWSDDLLLSFVALLVFGGLAAFALHAHFKKHDKIRLHKPPWMLICLGSISIAFMIVVHIANLFGLETGQK